MCLAAKRLLILSRNLLMKQLTKYSNLEIVMSSSLSWPLDSPISFGLALCLLGFFILGSIFYTHPNIFGRRKAQRNELLRNKRLGRDMMWGFGISCVLVLLISWIRSNNSRYAWLDN